MLSRSHNLVNQCWLLSTFVSSWDSFDMPTEKLRVHSRGHHFWRVHQAALKQAEKSQLVPMPAPLAISRSQGWKSPRWKDMTLALPSARAPNIACTTSRAPSVLTALSILPRHPCQTPSRLYTGFFSCLTFSYRTHFLSLLTIPLPCPIVALNILYIPPCQCGPTPGDG